MPLNREKTVFLADHSVLMAELSSPEKIRYAENTTAKIKIFAIFTQYKQVM